MLEKIWTHRNTYPADGYKLLPMLWKRGWQNRNENKTKDKKNKIISDSNKCSKKIKHGNGRKSNRQASIWEGAAFARPCW